MVSVFKFVLNVKTAEPFRPKFLFGTSQEKKNDKSAHCLNALFYQTKSIFRPTFSNWISPFYSSLESL